MTGIGLGIGAPFKKGEGSFLPRQIGILSHWYRKNLGQTEIDTGIDRWRDQKGGADLRQTVDFDRPSLGAGGIVQFNGTSDFMDVAFTASPPWTIWVRCRVIAHGETYILDGINSDSGAIYMTGVSPNTEFFKGAQGFGSINPVLNTWNNILLEINGASSRATLNNGTPVTGTLDGGSIGGLTIGGAGDDTRHSQTDFMEIALFNGILSTQAKADMQAYGAAL